MHTDPSTVSKAFIALLAEIAEIPEEKIHPESALRADLDIDSLAMVELFDATETQWNIKIPDEEAQLLTTVGEIVDYLRQKT
ncbi:acyl carrier protein [Actinosynnema sp. NPDC050436]|uniref:acyl carrier protein n=1 Tax=Actinosynnema sp. NPDC050436 TaxID=3155659 RepID=UPI003400A49E